MHSTKNYLVRTTNTQMGPVNVLKRSTCGGGRTRAQIKLKDVVPKARFENKLRNWRQWKSLSSISIRFASKEQGATRELD